MGADTTRVLIADSDAALRQRMYAALLEHDIFSDCVSTASDALEKLDADSYGLVVLDVALRGGEADRVIAAVHEMPVWQRPIVLVLAAHPEAARSLDVDIVQIVLRRPVQLRQLVDIIRSCLRTATRPGLAVPKEDGDGDQRMS